MLKEKILQILQSISISAGSGYTLENTNAIGSIEIGDEIIINLNFYFPIASQIDYIKNNIILKVRHLTDKNVHVKENLSVKKHVVQKEEIKPVHNIKNIIGIASAKGGVGKSTVTANLALALRQQRAKVGILDADIYGPSQPKLFNVEAEELKVNNKKFTPILKNGISIMSMGFLCDKNTPMVWRGPMISKALMQLLNDTIWPELDYLLVDLPPGTGDITLTMIQKVPLTGVAMVTTPQDLAVLDVRKSITMMQKVSVKMFGVIENMSMYICSQCGHKEHIFMSNGGEQLAKEFGLRFLGKIPLSQEICAQSDSGKPLLAVCQNNSIAKIYRHIALQLSVEVSKLPRNYDLPVTIV